MRVDALAVRLRPRGGMEAADLGVRLCQRASRSVYVSYACVALPLGVAAMACQEIAGWLPSVLIWFAKPWLDRTILYVLSRAAFGQATAPRDLWRDRRQVWWTRLLVTLTVQRASPWRSLTQPVYQLEGVSGHEARTRVAQIARGKRGTALLVTALFSLTETALLFSLISLVFWLAPPGLTPDLDDVLSGTLAPAFAILWSLGYLAVVLFLEPFYVAAGFGMYLNRRAELEAWDLEQEFRRAFAG